jgi:hypothetical protein
MVDPIIDAIVNDPSLAPVKDAAGRVVQTKCNWAIQRYLSQKHKYQVFAGKNADEICAMVDQHSEWMRVDGRQAQDAVNMGKTGLAVHPYVGHGHVAMIAPEDPPRLVGGVSGHWGQFCPLLGNVGEHNGYVAANFAFPVKDTPPRYYILDVSKIQA